MIIIVSGIVVAMIIIMMDDSITMIAIPLSYTMNL